MKSRIENGYLETGNVDVKYKNFHHCPSILRPGRIVFRFHPVSRKTDLFFYLDDDKQQNTRADNQKPVREGNSLRTENFLHWRQVSECDLRQRDGDDSRPNYGGAAYGFPRE